MKGVEGNMGEGCCNSIYGVLGLNDQVSRIVTGQMFSRGGTDVELTSNGRVLPGNIYRAHDLSCKFLNKLLQRFTVGSRERCVFSPASLETITLRQRLSNRAP